ncbi:MAG: NADPH-dependent F420 reductase [Ignavibacteria bacterium]
MNIGIIGSGKMGVSIGKLWAAKNHNIYFAALTLEESKAAAESINGSVKFGSISDAVDFADVILFSIPYSAVKKVIKETGSLKNKIIIDCINPLSPDARTLLIGHSSSAAEEISKLSPGASVVKAFNTVASPVLESGNIIFGDVKPTMFYCGDDKNAKSIVSKLIQDTGFEPVDAGPLINARYLEPLAALIIQLAFEQEMGTNIALKLLKR